MPGWRRVHGGGRRGIVASVCGKTGDVQSLMWPWTEDGYDDGRRRRQRPRGGMRLLTKNGLHRNTSADEGGAWKSEQDEESLKCWNLERIIEAELIGDPAPIDLTMEEFAGADESIQVIE